jgi:hypothetical protein
MVEACPIIGITDIHPGTLADRVEASKDLDA